ncbi:MAG: VWA domain-containing protein [Thermoanaerobaculia bacterium]
MKIHLAVLALVLLPLAASAQVRETVQVNLVEIPVNVVDGDGNPVRGLRAENFAVFDDGERREITHFEEIDLAKISADPETIIAPAARRNFLLVFDLSHSSPKALVRAREAARDFLLGSLLPRDLVAVATYSIEGGFQILTAFTTDRELVNGAILTLGHPQFYETRDPLLLAGGVAPGMMNASEVVQSEGPLELGFLRESELAGLAMQRMGDSHDRQRIDRQLEAFGEIAHLLNSIRGRKQVILLSEGFDARLVQGWQQDSAIEDRVAEFNALARGEIWKINNDDRFGNATTLRELDTMSRHFRRSDVVLHAIDIQGVPAASDARTGSQRYTSESHFLLADPTGGEVFKNTNDLDLAFKRMLKQQEVIYVLGFQTRTTGNPGKFHDLAVKVKVVGHRGLRVSHRAGYYEPTLQMSVVEQRLSATDILMNDIPFDDVSIDLLAAPFPLDDTRSQVPVIAEIGGEGFVAGVEGDVVNAELFIYAFDDDGTVRDFLFQTVSVDLTDARAALQQTGIKYYGTLALPPGEYSIKSLVRIVETGRNGFDRTRLVVPGHDEIALLPPLLFEEPGQWIMLKGAKTAEGQIEYPFILAEDSFIPSAKPVLVRGESYRLALFTRNIDPEAIRITARVESADGTQVRPEIELVGRTSQDEDGTVKLLLDFAPEDLLPGEYALHLTARAREGSEFRESSLPFRVVVAE